jgi:uncharacterized BrkB/YihY/UPF0761 family membrane protein
MAERWPRYAFLLAAVVVLVVTIGLAVVFGAVRHACGNAIAPFCPPLTFPKHPALRPYVLPVVVFGTLVALALIFVGMRRTRARTS